MNYNSKKSYKKKHLFFKGRPIPVPRPPPISLPIPLTKSKSPISFIRPLERLVTIKGDEIINSIKSLCKQTKLTT